MNKKRRREKAIFLLIPLSLFLFVACSGGGGNSTTETIPADSVTISGKVGSRLSRPLPRTAALQSPEEVWAIPIAKMQGMNLDPINLLLRKTETLGSDGSFSLNLVRKISVEEVAEAEPDVLEWYPAGTQFDVDWLLVLMQGNDPVNILSLPGDSIYDDMVSIPLTAFTPDAMNLGPVDPSSGSATLTVGEIEDDTTLSQETLQTITRSDDILKTIKDIVRNCDLSGGDPSCIRARQSFVFTGNYALLTDSSSFDRADTYTGYQFYLDLSSRYSKEDFDGICPGSGSAGVRYQLVPPGNITVNGTTYNSTNPLDTGVSGSGNRQDISGGEYTQCTKEGYPVYLWKANDNNDWLLQFITGDMESQLTTDMPAGDWVLKRKGSDDTNFTDAATFEFALANPVDDAGNPIIVVPAVRFDVNPDDALSTLHIKWYQHDGTNYREITDPTLLDSMMGGFEISLDDFTGLTGKPDRRSARQTDLSFADGDIDVSDLDGSGPFYFNYAGEDKYNLDYFGISYQFGGQSFRFAWRPDL